jgi:hypothetical protein
VPANNYRASVVVVIIRRRTHGQVSEDYAPLFYGHFRQGSLRRNGVCGLGRGLSLIGASFRAKPTPRFLPRRGVTSRTNALTGRFDCLEPQRDAVCRSGQQPNRQRASQSVGLRQWRFNIGLGIERWLAMCDATIQTSCGNELSYHSGQSETPRSAVGITRPKE